MERDMDARAEQRAQAQRTAYKCKERGNAAFKAGQYSEALKT